MIRAYRITPEGQELINRVREFDGMSKIELDLGHVLCQVKFELSDEGIFYYDASEHNIVPASWIMRLEARNLIKSDPAEELMCVLCEIEEGIEAEARMEWEDR